MHKKHRNKKSRKSRSQSKVVEDALENQEKYEIKTSKVMGRYMVATTDINPGEVILSEEAIVVGPCVHCKLQCLGCYTELGGKVVRCTGCGWFLCSLTCPGSNKKHGHTKLECSILKETKSSKYFDVKTAQNHLAAIVPLRCLLLKTTDPSMYDFLMDMESHTEIRKSIPEIWNNNQINVVDRITKQWGLTEFTPEEIHVICGILEVNCFEIGQQDVNIRGLYPKAFLMSHDCIPNTNHCDSDDYRLTVRASVSIGEGSPITLSYAYTLQNTPKRREHLLDNKFFECNCSRCQDPAELGAYSSALYCPKCSKGLVLANNPLDFETSYSCTSKTSGKCAGYTITNNSMKLLINRVSDEVDNINSNDVKAMEFFINKYRNVLHPYHYIFLGVKISLSQVYGKIQGYLINELTEDQLQRKIDICNELLSIFDIIEPGYTRIRGVTLYELHAPLMILLTKKFEKNLVSKQELKVKLREVVKCLLEASTILGNEPIASSEGMMGLAAQQALLQIKDWEKIVGRI
ncbi:unnamed protein product [Brassicogethes aeneus]|uniref:SET domain-containing protein n=1 Tax=Brassicogethes aeneus TaxID=1431903 RepID=A0A9P0FQK7_BRAAE|nr:unnamed protein product [Brassicogethes aeneus]